MTATLAYSTSTGNTTPYIATGQLETRDEVVELLADEHEPHCYVCGRHTDHFAEHDDLVEAGLAENLSNGDLVWTRA